MEPNYYIDRATGFYDRGFNCSQSLFMAYAPLLEIEVNQAARIAAPFGGGFGRLGRTCGVVTGALMALGGQLGHDVADNEAKDRSYALAREFQALFVERNGSVLCRDLLGRDISDPEQLELAREEEVFKTRCPGLIRDAAEIVGLMLSLAQNGQY
ncbi:MAG: C_GCAxxG_C_C family protein [Anaerolineales bacterium]|nr:C_GCAxxG_C_C family protein [Anaerolineales bacterium]